MLKTIGFLTLLLPWILIGYALWRNQRAAVASPYVDDTNFAARLAAIIEVILHPEHAVDWYRLLPPSTDPTEPHTQWAPVFPNLGKDSSEIHGHREDDGRVT